MLETSRNLLLAPLLLALAGCGSSSDDPAGAPEVLQLPEAPDEAAFPSNAELAGQNVVLSFVSWQFGGGVTTEAGKGNGFEVVRYRSSASGVVVDEDGTIVTNYHVAARAEDMTASFDAMADRGGATYRVPFIKVYDRDNDLAILKIDGAATFDSARLGDSDTVEPRDAVLAVGNPDGMGLNITEGSISSVKKDQRSGKPVRFVHTAATMGGSSGGSVYRGQEVVGIHHAGLARDDQFGKAVPVNFVKTLLDNPEYDRQLLLTDVFSDDFSGWKKKAKQVASTTGTAPARPSRDKGGVWKGTVTLLPQTDYAIEVKTAKGVDLDVTMWLGNRMIGLANSNRGGIEQLAYSNTILGAPEVSVQVHNYRTQPVNFGLTLYKIAW
jgi:S1-C subfamily serine protease